MVNVTFASGNVTLMLSDTRNFNIVTGVIFLIMSLLCLFFFSYFIAIMLKVFFTTPHMQENPRYILFVHMLINDTFYFIFTNVILVSNIHSGYLPMIVCFIIQTVTACSFRMTPYNLALMCLERYIAICFPLRHLQFCTSKKAKYAIAVVWVIELSLSIANFTTAISTKRTSYSVYVLCNSSMLIISSVQNVFITFINIISFILVALIIVFTYINIMLVARRISSGGSSAFKAGKTVILHAFQLMLCMASLISTVTDTLLKNYMYYVIISNYILFTCVTRFLSPFIYGVRDEVFRKQIRKYCPKTIACCPQLCLKK